jgi:hypothetical protein
LVNNGFLREKEMDLWRAAISDPYLMEKNLDAHVRPVRGA